jgi:hypothetical protein
MKTKIRKLMRLFLDQLGLGKWKVSKVVLGVPSRIISQNKREQPDSKGCWAAVEDNGNYTVTLYVAKRIPETKLRPILAHEAAHVLFFDLNASPRKDCAEERHCDTIARILV